jgi:hypothetical protein
MEFYCNICNKKYKSYQSLWKHNNTFHKKLKKEKEYLCIKCNKEFNNRQNKFHHQNKCNIIQKNNEEVANIINNDKEPTNIINNIGTANNMTDNNINSNNTINQNIIINNYGNDNIEYISEKFKDKLFQNFLCDEDYDIPIPKLIENIKFNPNHKENNNVKIKSDRSKIGFYYDEDKWKVMNKYDLLDDLCNYSLKILKTYFKEREY